MRMFTLRSFSNLTVAAALSCSALAGCGEDVVLPNVELVNRTKQAVSIMAPVLINGDYQNCINRSGPWQYDLRVAGGGAAAPTVIKRDAACKLNLLTLDPLTPSITFVAQGGSLYMDTAFGTPKLFASTAAVPQEVFVNARNNKAGNFDNNFNLEVLYSDTLDAATDAPINTTYSVVTSTVAAARVAAPNLDLNSTIMIKVLGDAARSIETITGNAILQSAAANAVDGQYYVVFNGLFPPSPTLAMVKAAYDAGNKTAVSAPIDFGTFGLATGSSLAMAYDRTVIVANFDANDAGQTTPSFKLFAFHFQAP